MDDEQEEDAISVTWEQIEPLLPAEIDLIYIDYRENLDDHLGVIEECIHNQSMEPLWELEFEEQWWLDASYDAIDYQINEELKPAIGREFLDEDDDDYEDQLDAIIEEHRDMIVQTLFDRDTSTPWDDLIRNTSDPIMFYGLGYDVPYGMDAEEADGVMAEIKKLLGITDSRYDDKMWLMLQQASYGGDLCVFFRAHDWNKLIDVGDNNVIVFKNPVIAIVDRCNGSGDHMTFDGLTLKLPLNVNAIYFDKVHSYSYTYEICNMVSDWCECTKATVKKIDYDAEIQGILVNMQSIVDNYRARISV